MVSGILTDRLTVWRCALKQQQQAAKTVVYGVVWCETGEDCYACLIQLKEQTSNKIKHLKLERAIIVMYLYTILKPSYRTGVHLFDVKN